MYSYKSVIFFLILILILKQFIQTSESFTNHSPSPAPAPAHHSSKNPSPSPSYIHDPKETPSPSITSQNTASYTITTKSNTVGIEILFECNSCNVDSFSEEQKRSIINAILSKYDKLTIENVEFKNGSVRVLIFLDADEVDIEYVEEMEKSLKDNSIIIVVGEFTLTSKTVKKIRNQDDDFKNNKETGCYGNNNRNNLAALKQILNSTSEQNVMLQFKPCGNANIFAPYISVNGSNVKHEV